MAEGISFENLGFDPFDWRIDDDDDDELGPATEQALSYQTSGEEIQMKTMHHKKWGLPEMSYAETLFTGAQSLNEQAFPIMSSSELDHEVSLV